MISTTAFARQRSSFQLRRNSDSLDVDRELNWIGMEYDFMTLSPRTQQDGAAVARFFSRHFGGV
jgi:hypothetical protein